MMSLSFLKSLHIVVVVLQFGLLAPIFWRATGAEVRCIEWERQALLQFKAGLVDTYDFLSSWESDEEDKRDCCNISSSLMKLHDLMAFNLSLNTFQNSQIPEFFGSLSNLRYLSLYGCGFKGNIPSQLGSLSHLQYLNLGYNNLKGSIPYQLGNLSNLQLLNLRGNNFVGPIPHQLGNLSKLQELYLADIVSLKTDKENGVGG
ncbi:receptor-like protein 12 [Senna tora]|uniref:Receptor-like protein 12 n=1 Tax=Senna tora TaxID=362788 RepID=A0A834XJL7_9FABA|nr:receptor-like protein 12 [Senna tora]